MNSATPPGKRPNEDLRQLLAEALNARQYIKDHPEAEQTPCLADALQGDEASPSEPTLEEDFLEMDPAELRQLITHTFESDEEEEDW